jgi:hypothetical protein
MSDYVSALRDRGEAIGTLFFPQSFLSLASIQDYVIFLRQYCYVLINDSLGGAQPLSRQTQETLRQAALFVVQQ